MPKQNEGWYWTWFYDGNKTIDEFPENDVNDGRIQGYC